jgi:hypothetical protein
MLKWLSKYRDEILAQVLSGIIVVVLSLVFPAIPTLNKYLPHQTPFYWVAIAFVIGAILTGVILRRRSKTVLVMTNNPASLGISQIYSTRTQFEARYPFHSILEGSQQGDKVRFVGVTLFNLMTQPTHIKNAIDRGVVVELCLLNPTIPLLYIRDKPDLNLGDIHIALEEFKKKIASWISTKSPSGSVEVRYHNTCLFDSFAFVETSSKIRFSFWDLSFGRAMTDKRVIVVDSTVGIGKDLLDRYGIIWANGEPDTIYKYENMKVVIDKL